MAVKLPTVTERTDFPADSPDPAWSVSIRVGRDVKGRMVIGRVEIKPALRSLADVGRPLPEGGITTKILRSLKLSMDRREAGAWVAMDAARMTRKSPTGRGRPRVYSDAFYRKFAGAHQQLCRKRSDRVVPELATTFGLTVGATHKMVRRCRDRGLID